MSKGDNNKGNHGRSYSNISADGRILLSYLDDLIDKQNKSKSDVSKESKEESKEDKKRDSIEINTPSSTTSEFNYSSVNIMARLKKVLGTNLGPFNALYQGNLDTAIQEIKEDRSPLQDKSVNMIDKDNKQTILDILENNKNALYR